MAITLTGKQQEVLALPAKGHIVVLGTAGSGKTTIALHRARHLANIPGSGRILLVTFNRALVEYMKGIDYIQSSKLTVENYHRFARGYLNARGKMPKWNGILSPEQKECYIGQALEKLKVEHPEESTLKRPREFFVDEITFIERFGFNNLAEYREAERIGRASSNIKRENRKWIYAVYEEYQTLRQTDEPRYDWDDLALYDSIFNDWTVLYIYLDILKEKRIKFSPCNASRGRGAYINEDEDEIEQSALARRKNSAR